MNKIDIMVVVTILVSYVSGYLMGCYFTLRRALKITSVYLKSLEQLRKNFSILEEHLYNIKSAEESHE